MSNYLDGIDGGKHNSNNVETSITPKTFEVSLTFTDISAKNPLEATKKILEWIKDDAEYMIYDVKDEINGSKYTVDLSEKDEDAVLPNND
jgi:hypothetical protein